MSVPVQPLRILVFTTLFPNAVRPSHGVFVERRLRHLLRSERVEARVVAPVPWFPQLPRNVQPWFGRYSEYSRVPPEETRSGVEVLHPRYPTIPKIGTTPAPFLLAGRALPTLYAVRRDGYDFDLIDAHYFYPDGVAAWLMGRALGKPFVITARGSDVYQFPKHPVARRLIVAAAHAAGANIAVSAGLKAQLCKLGVAGEHIRVLRNGVDPQEFKLHDRASMRTKHGLDVPGIDRWACSVGNLVPLKSHDLVLAALARLPGIGLAIVGEGPERPRLEQLAHRLGIGARVRFLGVLPSASVNEVMAAADVMVLASSQEGWPNVLLESMASGTPVVASDIEGTREVVGAPEAGILVERSAEAIAAGTMQLLRSGLSRESTRAYAERYSWDETSRGQAELFRSVVDAKRSAANR